MGARCGYVNPDATTFEYLKGRPYSPEVSEWDAAVECWQGYASDEGCHYDDVVNIRAEDIEPTVTWWDSPGQAIFVSENVPTVEGSSEDDKEGVQLALEHMQLNPGAPIKGTKIDVAFFGSCTNARYSDFIEAAKFLRATRLPQVSKQLPYQARNLLPKFVRTLASDKVFEEAGFRVAGRRLFDVPRYEP